jgi:hypothetical protein
MNLFHLFEYLNQCMIYFMHVFLRQLTFYQMMKIGKNVDERLIEEFQLLTISSQSQRVQNNEQIVSVFVHLS